MKRFFVYTLGFIALAFVTLLLVAAARPSTYKVERSTIIAASPDIVYNNIANLHNWEKWSPWKESDPTVKNTYEGDSIQVGSSFSWVGQKSGEGKLTVTELRSGEYVGFDMAFFKPQVSISKGYLSLKSDIAGVQTTWGMTGENDLPAKIFTMFKPMDALLGPDFDKGLDKLSELSQKQMLEMPVSIPDSTALKQPQ
jgi:Polyketide cyclase / dehydrase and lipid transport